MSPVKSTITSSAQCKKQTEVVQPTFNIEDSGAFHFDICYKPCQKSKAENDPIKILRDQRMGGALEVGSVEGAWEGLSVRLVVVGAPVGVLVGSEM